MALIQNKKFHLNFEAQETFEAGIELFGFEVKSVRNKLGSLDGAYVIVRGGEAYLVNTYIPPYQPANSPDDYDPYRTRRLLLKKKEIAELAGAEQQKRLTIVPKSMYNSRGKIKVEIAIAQGKKKYDKREDIKKRDMKRDVERDLRDL
ncbi:MAG: SsrA-binding protein SmpB [Candidatus Paceibacterota bacterium]